MTNFVLQSDLSTANQIVLQSDLSTAEQVGKIRALQSRPFWPAGHAWQACAHAVPACAGMWAHLWHINYGPELLLEGVAEVAWDATHLSLHHASQEVRQAMIRVLQGVQLVGDPCCYQHSLLLVGVYNVCYHGVACRLHT